MDRGRPFRKRSKSAAGKRKKFPIFVGSGCDRKNAKELYKFANGAIVSTSLKNGCKTSKEINTKPYAARINGKKVRDFIKNL